MKLHSNFLRLVCLLAVVAVLLLADVASACPTCRDGLSANDPHYANVARGYFYSILFMLAMPFTLLSCFGLYIYREVRKARARDAAQANISKVDAELVGASRD